MSLAPGTRSAPLTPDQRSRILAAVDAAFDEQLRFTQELVRHPSLRAAEGSAQDLLARAMAERGLDVDRWELDADALSIHPGAGAVEISYEGVDDVVGTYRPRRELGRSLILNGHVDVVPEGPEEQWHRSPWDSTRPDRPGLICLSYTWNDDALRWLPMTAAERADVAISHLERVYPGLDIRSHVVGEPVTVSWEQEPHFAGGFKINLPGHYRYQRQLYAHFVEGTPVDGPQRVFLAGDDVSWTAGWVEGAITTALNAVWGVQRTLGGATHPDNPGPGDCWSQLQPVRLSDPAPGARRGR